MLVDINYLHNLANYAKKKKIHRVTAYKWKNNEDLAMKKGVKFIDIDGHWLVFDKKLPNNRLKKKAKKTVIKK